MHVVQREQVRVLHFFSLLAWGVFVLFLTADMRASKPAGVFVPVWAVLFSLA